MQTAQHPDITRMSIDEVMAWLGVGRSEAYKKVRLALAEKHDGIEVPSNQRERMLTTLYRNPETRRSHDLQVLMQHEGYAIDAHDTVKVLWSLQKTRHVKFRESLKTHELYAIKLTSQGQDEAIRTIARTSVDAVVEVPAPVVVEEEAAPVVVEEVQEEPQASAPPIGPALDALRQRAAKAVKLTAAAKLLEEVGEDTIALELIDMATFTPLEEEVIALLRHYGEN